MFDFLCGSSINYVYQCIFFYFLLDVHFSKIFDFKCFSITQKPFPPHFFSIKSLLLLGQIIEVLVYFKHFFDQSSKSSRDYYENLKRLFFIQAESEKWFLWHNYMGKPNTHPIKNKSSGIVIFRRYAGNVMEIVSNAVIWE